MVQILSGKQVWFVLRLKKSAASGMIKAGITIYDYWQVERGVGITNIIKTGIFEEYSKRPHIRTYDFGVEADQGVISQVLSEESAWKCS